MTKTTDLKTFMEVFFGKLVPCFRPPSDNPANAKALVQIYHAELSRFDAAVLAKAASVILKTRKDPFFPTLADCLDACRKVNSRTMPSSVPLTAPLDGWITKRGDM